MRKTYTRPSGEHIVLANGIEGTMDDQVYIIGSPGSPIVKIGVSNDPRRRLRQIQSMSPLPLTVLWTCSGSYELEGRLHAHLRSYRSHGEWFNLHGLDPVKAVQEAVAEVLQASTSPPVKRGSAPSARVTDGAAVDCVCGHEHGLHRRGRCTVAGSEEWRDCQCSAYTPVSVLRAVLPLTRQPDLRPVTTGWSGPTPPEGAAAKKDPRHAVLLAEITKMRWPSGEQMVPGYWPEYLATCILWRLRSTSIPDRYPAIVLGEIVHLKWPHGEAMVPGSLAEHMTDRIMAYLL